jgi:hypothetical protein
MGKQTKVRKEIDNRYVNVECEVRKNSEEKHHSFN